MNFNCEIHNRELHNIVKNSGASYFGVADLSSAKDAIIGQGGSRIGKYPYAVSIGIVLPHAIVDMLPERSEYSVALNYRHHCYDVINQRLDLIASIIAGHIQGKGYEAFPIPSSERIDEQKAYGEFSHKLAAHLAGLGWIGKSCLLVTPDNGPRVRWISVLTDAPLKPARELMHNRCGTCTACVDVCPVKAFTGRDFREDEPREARYDTRKCEDYFKAIKKDGHLDVCGMCLYVCPFGRHNRDKR